MDKTKQMEIETIWDTQNSKSEDFEEQIWLPVRFEPSEIFEKMHIARNFAAGKDVFIDNETGGYFQKIYENGMFRRMISKRRVWVSINLLRKMHFDYPDYCDLIDFSIKDPSEKLRQFLLSQADENGLKWAKVWKNEGYIVNRDGTLVVGGRDLVRKPLKHSDTYFHTVFFVDGKNYNEPIGRVVWKSFHGKEIRNGYTIHHRNRKNDDNRLENLHEATPSEPRASQGQRTEYSNYDWSIEVWTPETGIWTIYPSKRELLRQFPDIKHATLRCLLSGTQKGTRKGFIARYRTIETKNDLSGRTEQWIPIPGSRHFVSNAPDFPDEKTPHASKGARFSTLTASGVRVRVNFVPRVDGYVNIRAGDGRFQKLHRVIFQMFKGNIPVGFDVDHIDGDHTNNFWMNLQALSKKEHAVKTLGKPVMMNAVMYDSIASAAFAASTNSTALALRLKRKADPNIYFVEQPHQKTSKRPRI